MQLFIAKPHAFTLLTMQNKSWRGNESSQCCMRLTWACWVDRAGLLVRQEGGKGQFGALKRAFRLLVDDVHDKDPQDAAYVYSGYAPLSVRPRCFPNICYLHCATFTCCASHPEEHLPGKGLPRRACIPRHFAHCASRLGRHHCRGGEIG